MSKGLGLKYRTLAEVSVVSALYLGFLSIGTNCFMHVHGLFITAYGGMPI